MSNLNGAEFQSYLYEVVEELKKELEAFSKSLWDEYESTMFIGEAANGKVKMGWKNRKFSSCSFDPSVSPEALPDLLCVAASDAVNRANEARKFVIRDEDSKMFSLANEAAKRASGYATRTGATPEEINQFANSLNNMFGKPKGPIN